MDTALAKLYNDAKCRYSGRPSTYSPQNASAVQLGVSQPICGAAVKFRQAHGRPVLPFGPTANNCRSEHIHRMLLSDVAVKTEQHEGKYIDLTLGKRFTTKCLSFFLILNLKYLQRLYIL